MLAEHGVLYIGVDPGKSGGVACLKADGSVYTVRRMPETDRDILDVFEEAAGAGVQCFAFIERVHSSPQMGVASAFTFGQGFGGLRMALTAALIPFEEVMPKRWQKAMGCLSGGDKNVTRRRAQELFPLVKVTHAIADALLIAEYRRRVGNHVPDASAAFTEAPRPAKGRTSLF